MNILHTVQNYFPAKGGMQEVVRQLSERLASYGHQVVVATHTHPERSESAINGVKTRSFRVSGNFVLGFKGESKRYQEFILSNKFDVIVNFAAQQWATDCVLPLLSSLKTKKVFVPTGFSALPNIEYTNYFQSMKLWMNLYDANVFHSSQYRDYQFAQENNIKNLHIIPNGADEREFLLSSAINMRTKMGISTKNTLILHVGSHSGDKGHIQAIEIFKRANLSNATLIIVGNKEKKGCYYKCLLYSYFFKTNSRMKKDKKKLIVVDLPREEIISLYKSADLFLFPSRIECSPIVLYECLASRTPFLATDVGNVREIIEKSKSGILLPTNINFDGYSDVDINESARILSKMMKDKNQLQKMAENGYTLWKKEYTWENITKKYERLYKSLLS